MQVFDGSEGQNPFTHGKNLGKSSILNYNWSTRSKVTGAPLTEPPRLSRNIFKRNKSLKAERRDLRVTANSLQGALKEIGNKDDDSR